jgi:hypothetical protein
VPAPITGTKKVSKPRQFLRTPEEQTLLTKKAAAQGDVEGEIAGLIASGIPDAEARQLVAMKYRRAAVGTAPFQAIGGETVDPDGTVRQTYATFNRATAGWEDVAGTPLSNFRQRPTGAAAARFGVTREAIARSKYGKDFRDLSQAEATDVMAEEQEYIESSAGRRTEGAGAGKMNVPTDIRASQLAGVPVGTRATQVEGQRVGTMAQQQRRMTAGDIRGQLQHIKTLLTPLPKATDVLGGVAPGAVMALRQRDPRYRNQIAQLTSAINNIRASLTRTMQANVGTETERDAERALSTMVDFEGRFLDPLKGDTQESAGLRIDETLRYLDEVLQSIPGAPVVGAPPPTLAPSSGARAPEGVGAQGPVGYTVNEQGQLLLNGQPVP